MIKRLFGCILLVLTINLYSKELVINQPSIEFNTSGIMNVSRIELKNDETIVYIHSLRKPSQDQNAFIEDCTTGERWKALHISQEEFNKEIYVDELEDNISILVFPKLDEKVNRINYGEGNRIIIYGISLNKEQMTSKDNDEIPVEVFDWIDQELSKAPQKTLLKLTNNTSFKGVARLIGYIHGYDRRAGFSTGMMYVKNISSNKISSYTIHIHNDGRFEGTIPSLYPAPKYAVFKDISFSFYIEPGQTLATILNWEDFLEADIDKDKDHYFRNIRFSGPLAQVNQELSDIYHTLKEPNFDKIYNQSIQSDKELFRIYLDSITQDYRTVIKEAINANTLHPTTKVILTNYLQQITEEWMMEKSQSVQRRE